MRPQGSLWQAVSEWRHQGPETARGKHHQSPASGFPSLAVQSEAQQLSAREGGSAQPA